MTLVAPRGAGQPEGSLQLPKPGRFLGNVLWEADLEAMSLDAK